jgi:four helix bundle protein
MVHDSQRTRFVHQRLDAYRVSLELFGEVERLADGFPRGHADLKDQVRRSAAATVRHIAEGADRIQPRDKAARFMLARAECGECDATLDMARIVGLVSEASLARLQHLTARVSAMLLGLIRRERGRARP